MALCSWQYSVSRLVPAKQHVGLLGNDKMMANMSWVGVGGRQQVSAGKFGTSVPGRYTVINVKKKSSNYLVCKMLMGRKNLKSLFLSSPQLKLP